MLDRVTIVDDSGRLNACATLERGDRQNWERVKGDMLVKQQVKREFFGTFYFPLVDQKTKRRVQDVVERRVVVEGQYLRNLATRARRFIRNAGIEELGDPPSHIGLALLCLLRADPDGFKAAMEARGA